MVAILGSALLAGCAAQKATTEARQVADRCAEMYGKGHALEKATCDSPAMRRALLTQGFTPLEADMLLVTRQSIAQRVDMGQITGLQGKAELMQATNQVMHQVQLRRHAEEQSACRRQNNLDRQLAIAHAGQATTAYHILTHTTPTVTFIEKDCNF
jgi:hypothetical protein